MEGSNLRTFLTYLGVVVLLSALVFVLFTYVSGTGAFGGNYLTGMIVFDDFNTCGLVKTRHQDWMGCKIAPETCAELREYANKRVRLTAWSHSCSPETALQCSYTAEFNQAGFKATDCFSGMKVIRTL